MNVSCGVLYLTDQDITEGLLSGAVLSIPSGVHKLAIAATSRDVLNENLGYEDRVESYASAALREKRAKKEAVR
jgi:hypothetical protein